MKSLTELLTEIINTQKFRDAVGELEKMLAEFAEISKQNKNEVELVLELTSSIKNHISNTQVINPMQYDALYAYVKQNTLKAADKAMNIKGFSEYYQHINKRVEQEFSDELHQTNNKIERGISGGYCAVCDKIITNDGKTIAFSET